jgi:RNA polymerase sigma factor (sigma-70 family)
VDREAAVDELEGLVVAARTGALKAYGQIVLRFQDMAYAAALARLGDHHLAQDAAQEAFVEAFIHLPKLQEPAAFPGWFRQILFRQCARLIRGGSLALVPLEAAAELPSPEPGPERTAEEREMRRQVLDAVRSLPDNERIVTALFYIREYSYKQVSDFLGVPLTTVKKRLYSARKRLRERMVRMVQDGLRERRPSKDASFANLVQLGSAAAKGDLAGVQALLARHPELINQRDAYGDTALGRAARWGRREVVRYLLEHGADVNVKREGRDAGWPALFWACGYQADPQIVALLIDHGADVRDRASHAGASDDTVLHSAARWGHTEVIELLIAHGADVQARDQRDCGILAYDVGPEVAALLREDGATE